MRNPPPISTNWERDMITFLPLVNTVKLNNTAEALLFTTSADSVPSSCWNWDSA